MRQAPGQFGLARRRWRLADLQQVLAGRLGGSRSRFCRALQRLRITRQRGRLGLHSPAPAYAAKLVLIARARAAARQDPTRVRLVYGDECSLYRQPTLAETYAPAGQSPRAPLSWHSNKRPWRYSGALDAVSGQVIWTQWARMGIEALCAFLDALRAAMPDPTVQLLLVWDNWPIHQHPTVLEHAAALGIHLLWLPTYAPWTNPIEKLWRWLRQDLVHHHHLADRWADLKQQVATFLEHFAPGSPALLRYVGLLPG